MKHVVVSTCNQQQWRQFGGQMARQFCKFWPTDVELWFYAERFEIELHEAGLRVLDLDDCAPWLSAFKARHKDPRQRGLRNGSYDYRQDAVRFCHKVAAIGAAAEASDCDVLIWMDADMVTHARVTHEWLRGLLPSSAAVAWLDRIGTCPECGFLMFRLPAALGVVRSLIELYRSDEVLRLPETHDSFAIQHIVQQAQKRRDIVVHSLSGEHGRKCGGHPLANSPLSACLDHLKGTLRKQLGRTPIAERRLKDDVAYWRA